MEVETDTKKVNTDSKRYDGENHAIIIAILLTRR